MLGERKYFLDWLRVIAFGFLIFFHVGLQYVDWGNNTMGGRIFPELEYLLMCISPWRLVLLFFISGVASRFLIEKLQPGRFSLERVRRLFIVLLLGMFVIVPIQVYFELLHNGQVNPGYMDFWLDDYMQEKRFPGYILPSWSHLWFLIYLLIYAQTFALLFKLFRRDKPFNIPLWVLIVVPGIWLCTANVVIEQFSPVTMDLFHDWGNHLRWIGAFSTGILCAGRKTFWEFVKNARRRLLVVSLIGLTMYLGNYMYWQTGAEDPFWDGIIYGVIRGFYGWAGVLTLAGYAYKYINRQSPLLRYLTDAVLPVYVVHQPIIIVAAYYLFPLSLPFLIESVLMCLITGIGSFAFYELFVRRWRIARFLFGLKITVPVNAGNRSSELTPGLRTIQG